MSNSKNVSKFFVIGATAFMASHAALAQNYQVIYHEADKVAWYEPAKEPYITIKTEKESVIALQQAYRSEDTIYIIPPNTEKNITVHAFQECFRFIDENKSITKKCF